MSTFTEALSEIDKEFNEEFGHFHVCAGCGRWIVADEFCTGCDEIHESLKARQVDPLRTAVWTGLLIGCMVFWGWLAVHAWRWL